MRKSDISILIVTLILVLGAAAAHNSAQAVLGGGVEFLTPLTTHPLPLYRNDLFASFRSGERIGPNIEIGTKSDRQLPNDGRAIMVFAHLVKESESINSIILFYTGEVTPERYQQLVDLNRMLSNSSASWDGETIYAGRLLLIPGSWIRIKSYTPEGLNCGSGRC